MKSLFNLPAVMIYGILLAITDVLSAQQVFTVKTPVYEEHFPISDEPISMAEYPLKSDQQLGVSTAILGENRLYQVDATLVEIQPAELLPPDRHLFEEVI